MPDRRAVKLLVHSRVGEFLVLYRSHTHPIWPHWPDLPGGAVESGETDIQALDREIREEMDVMLPTEDAIQIGYDAEYEPGDGLITRVLYMLKIEQDNLPIKLSWEHEHFAWLPAGELQGFEPPYQTLVQVALDFYLPLE